MVIVVDQETKALCACMHPIMRVFMIGLLAEKDSAPFAPQRC
jgi:hypothetical protein